jgi:hypothetical protein
MTHLASYVVAGLAAVLAADYFNPVVGTSAELSGAAPAAVSMQVVDRSHKGDRLDQDVLSVRGVQPIEVRPVHVQIFHRPQPLSLPEGCDALNPLAGSPLSDLAGRCLTDNAGGQKLAVAGRSPGWRQLI